MITPRNVIRLVLLLAAATTLATLNARAQSLNDGPTGPMQFDASPASFASRLSDTCRDSASCDASAACSNAMSFCGEPALVAGAEFLLVRPHFSEAIAYAEGTQTAGSFNTSSRALDFDYAGSLRAYLGYRLASGSELRFTYWYANSDTTADGSFAGPGQFIVDPFGNLVGGVVILNPADRRFLSTVTGGDTIRTQASVRTSVYDVEFIRPFAWQGGDWHLEWSAGVRLADIDQYYESVITLGGNPFSAGSFSAEFLGAGPRLGLQAVKQLGQQGCFSVFANTHGSLLLGDHQIEFNNTDAGTGFTLGQTEAMTRTIPVLEAELGVTTNLWSRLDVSLGWTFQAWYDLGTSGGTFGGLYGGADDANVMSYDGLFVRGQLTY